MTNIATKNGSIIVKGGSVAEGCNCCGGWYCDAAPGCNSCESGTVPEVLTADVTFSVFGSTRTLERQLQRVQDEPQCHAYNLDLTFGQGPFTLLGATCNGFPIDLGFQGRISIKFTGPCGYRELLPGLTDFIDPQENQVVVIAFPGSSGLNLSWIIAPDARTYNPAPGTPFPGREFMSDTIYKHTGGGMCYGDVGPIVFPISVACPYGGPRGLGTVTLAVKSAA